MGYSCTQDADNMLGLIRHTFNMDKYSNGLTIGGRSYFYEIGREHADGHITGTLYENLPDLGLQKAGHFCILANGQISRFPRLKQRSRVLPYSRFAKLKLLDPALLNSYSNGVI